MPTPPLAARMAGPVCLTSGTGFKQRGEGAVKERNMNDTLRKMKTAEVQGILTLVSGEYSRTTYGRGTLKASPGRT